MTTVAIVGAGPAGLGAAEQLVAAGLRPVLVDEQPHVGGRHQGARAHGAGTSVLARWGSLQARVDHRPGTLVWQIEDRTLHLIADAGRLETLRFDGLILAPGATDRVLPFPGWTLPGVFTLGGAQTMLTARAALLGPRIVFAGTGPLLVLVAAQHVAAGACVQAVLDVAPAGATRRAAAPLLAARPALALRGMRLLMRLRLAGVPVHHGVTLVGAEAGVGGDERVARLRWRCDGADHRTRCDVVAVGHGLRSETQLADLAGCAFEWDPLDEAWLPRCDRYGRSSVAGVFLAGDGAAIRGADAAELAGARAAQALLDDLGVRCALPRVPDRVLRRHDRWRNALGILSPPSDGWAAQVPDDLVVCRCEGVTAGELRVCARDEGARELNRLKAFTRVGMGRCQGRMCAAAAGRLLAQTLGVPLADVGRLRAQPPVKPLPIASLAARSALEGHGEASTV